MPVHRLSPVLGAILSLAGAPSSPCLLNFHGQIGPCSSQRVQVLCLGFFQVSQPLHSTLLRMAESIRHHLGRRRIGRRPRPGPVDWDPYEPVQYDAPENPYDTTIVDYEPEVESSDVDSDDESFHTKTRHVLRRLQSGQYDGPFARGIYKCPFCNRRLRDTDFNTLLNHVESIGRYGARVGRTVNVHAYMAKHKALGIHLRNLQASHTRYLEALNVPTALSVCDCSICRAA
ncbi:hypothetical protein QYE76_012764 [Lolium multiflorum]|uniref:Uncharacterized protein n=1 Tax=Lolium multiflorum TaxID=4521 RepID=A0AAD8TZV4_LOLMU|nr:hypothetical protein QYE76_012764 [Lolium multiflorum]